MRPALVVTRKKSRSLVPVRDSMAYQPSGMPLSRVAMSRRDRLDGAVGGVRTKETRPLLLGQLPLALPEGHEGLEGSHHAAARGPAPTQRRRLRIGQRGLQDEPHGHQQLLDDGTGPAGLMASASAMTATRSGWMAATTCSILG